MKKSVLVFATLILFAFTSKENKIPDHDNPGLIEVYQSGDKEFLLDYFQQTNDTLSKSVEGLSKEQMQFKPSEEKWSVSQCMDHIVMTEKMILGMTRELLAQTANPERKEEVKISDNELINGITDRSLNASAPKELQPQGKYTNPTTALQDLEKVRAEIFNIIEQTSLEDLRNHITDSPRGPINAFHTILYCAAHTARHTSQIKEVMNDAGFPSK